MIREAFLISQAVPTIDIERAEQLFQNLASVDSSAWRRDLISRLKGIENDATQEQDGAEWVGEGAPRQAERRLPRWFAARFLGSTLASLKASSKAVIPATGLGGALAASFCVALAATAVAAAFVTTDQLLRTSNAAIEQPVPAPVAALPDEATMIVPAVANEVPELTPALDLIVPPPVLATNVVNRSQMIALKSIDTTDAAFTPPLTQPLQMRAELKAAAWRSTSTPLVITLTPGEQAHLVSLIAIRGLPPEMSMTRGKLGKSNVWMLTADELSGLAINHPRQPSQPVTLTIGVFIRGAIRQEMRVVLPARSAATASIRQATEPAPAGQMVKTSTKTEPATPQKFARPPSSTQAPTEAAKATLSPREPDWKATIWSRMMEYRQ